MRGYIIKKQETSSFSPALVKILNGDFMLPVGSSRAHVPRGHARACAAAAHAGISVSCSAATARIQRDARDMRAYRE